MENTELNQLHSPSHEDAVVLAECALDDAITALGLNADTAASVKKHCLDLVQGKVNATAVKTFANGICHDNDVSNAHNEGYLKGKNEKIEISGHFNNSEEFNALRNAIVPNFVRRSVWDID